MASMRVTSPAHSRNRARHPNMVTGTGAQRAQRTTPSLHHPQPDLKSGLTRKSAHRRKKSAPGAMVQPAPPTCAASYQAVRSCYPRAGGRWPRNRGPVPLAPCSPNLGNPCSPHLWHTPSLVCHAQRVVCIPWSPYHRFFRSHLIILATALTFGTAY